MSAPTICQACGGKIERPLGQNLCSVCLADVLDPAKMATPPGDRKAMKCEICNDGPPNGPAVYRVNPIGELPAIWRCMKDLTPTQRNRLDPAVVEFVEAVEDSNYHKRMIEFERKHNPK